MQRPKILQLRSSIGYFGAENVIVELAQSLAHTGYQTIIGVLNNRDNPHLEMVEAAEKYKLETATFECSGKLSLQCIFAIRQYIKRNNIAIVHSHGYKSNFYALFSTLRKNIPLICTCHPWLETEVSVKARFYAWLDKNMVLKRFSHIVAVSVDVKNELLSHGIADGRLSLIPNGINIQRFSHDCHEWQMPEEITLKPGGKYVGTIGRLSREKGQDVLIEAAKLVLDVEPHTQFIIVGDGPYKTELMNRVHSLGLQDRVVFTGICNTIPEIMSFFDLFVLPSRTEGLPMVLLEAMAAHKAVVATDVGDVASVITNNKSGVLIEPENAAVMGEAIVDLLQSQTKRQYLAGNAFNKVKREFSSAVMAQRYAELYEKIYRERTACRPPCVCRG